MGRAETLGGTRKGDKRMEKAKKETVKSTGKFNRSYVDIPIRMPVGVLSNETIDHGRRSINSINSSKKRVFNNVHQRISRLVESEQETSVNEPIME